MSLDSFPIAVAVGTALGFLSGLGVGGGSLLILWLTLVLGMDAAAAREINLLFFLPSAVICCLFRWRQGTLPLKKVIPAMVGGCLAAVCFSWLGARMEPEPLKRLFGLLLVATGIRELCYKGRRG